ncbi:hypothetical protein V1520DRAFT_277074, partial [Lipomyces starkeyi]
DLTTSHITAPFIDYCMETMISQAHCSHVLQPPDISVLGPLKTAFRSDTDAITRIGIC